MNFELIVRPRRGACDPQAEAVSAAMSDSGFTGCQAASVGRYLLLSVTELDVAAATARAHEVCRAMLVNPNLESYELRPLPAEPPESERR
jgi:phosphoribosylformylglycinamidine (FGAM) synthase PurS component